MHADNGHTRDGIRMCYPDRVEGPHFVPGLPHMCYRFPAGTFYSVRVVFLVARAALSASRSLRRALLAP